MKKIEKVRDIVPCTEFGVLFFFDDEKIKDIGDKFWVKLNLIEYKIEVAEIEWIEGRNNFKYRCNIIKLQRIFKK